MTEPKDIKSQRVGIIGGGQLGMMLCQAANRLSVSGVVLTDDATSPATYFAERDFTAGLDDLSALQKLIECSDVITFELEAVPDQSLDLLSDAVNDGKVKVHPSVDTLRLIKDKGVQKTWLHDQGLPTLPFILIDEQANSDDLLKKGFCAPVVQKVRRGGYDGKGVQILWNAEDLDRLWPAESVIEPALPNCTEVAVVVARDQYGEMSAFPPVTMEFDETLNAVSVIVSPGVLEPAQQTKCLQIALDAVGALGAIGVFAVELFITAAGEFFINEISPRVHNSGHLTMDGFQHDQFEQHIRAVSGRSIGPIVPRAPAAVMLNLLYDDNLSNAHTGAPYSVALDDDHMTFAHWYGKKEAREGRKMGHINAMGHSRDQALARARAGLKVLCSEAFNPSVDLYKAVKR